MLPHYLEKLKYSNLLHFCILYYVPIKGSYKLMVVISSHLSRMPKPNILAESYARFHKPFCESAAYLLD